MKTTINIKLDGEDVYLDFAPDLTITDISAEMDRVAAEIGWAGEIWGETKRQMIVADAEYRTWRANEARKLLDADPKMPEWKVKAAIESSPGFMIHKKRIADTERNEAVMATVVAAFKHKSEQLRSKGAAKRAELEATGMRTKSDREDAIRASIAESRDKSTVSRRKS